VKEGLGFVIQLLMWLLGLAAAGVISPELAAGLLVMLIALRSIGRAVKWAFRLVAPAALLTTLFHYSGGDVWPAVASFLALLLAAFGVWLIFAPFRR
jgi:hypothetical protein